MKYLIEFSTGFKQEMDGDTPVEALRELSEILTGLKVATLPPLVLIKQEWHGTFKGGQTVRIAQVFNDAQQ